MVNAEGIDAFRSIRQSAIDTLRMKLSFESRLVRRVIRVSRRIEPAPMYRFGIDKRVQGEDRLSNT